MIHPYQEEGVEWLALDERRYLADQMGLGKTVQAILRALQIGGRVGVVAPAAVLPQWEVEWKRWAPQERVPDLISYAARKGWDERYDVVILDEAHFVKNRDAQRTLRALTLAQRATYAILLSGTPMPNGPQDLWAPIRALWPEIPEELGIGSYQEWIDRFCRYHMYRPSKWAKPRPVWHGGKNLDQLAPHLKRIMLRRTVQGVGLQMPPFRVSLQYLERGKDFPALTDLSNPEERHQVGLWKAPRIADLVADELQRGEYEKIVVLAHHHDVLDAFQGRLPGAVRVDGKTPPQHRARAIERFNEDPKVKVFLGQQTATGAGLNLQVANEIVLAEPAWTPGENGQALKRIHRIGSTLPCRARIFAVAGTVDDRILSANRAKIQDWMELNQ